MILDHLCMYRPPNSRCEIDLEHGDVTRPPSGTLSDLLVISAFSNDYLPTSTSVMGTLRDNGLDVANNVIPFADRIDANCWISRELDGPDALRAGARRILCYETDSRNFIEKPDPTEFALTKLRSIFSALLQRVPLTGDQRWSVSMPVLCSGDQGADPQVMLRLIVAGLQESFAMGLAIESVRIVERNALKAGELSKTFLGLKEEYNPFVLGIRPEIEHDLFISYSHQDEDVVHDIHKSIKGTFENDHLRVFLDVDGKVNEGAILSRDLARAVRSSRSMLAFVSPDYVSSASCHLEYSTGYRCSYLGGDFLLRTVFLRGAISDFPKEYRDLFGADCTKNSQEATRHINEIVRSVAQQKLLSTASQQSKALLAD